MRGLPPAERLDLGELLESEMAPFASETALLVPAEGAVLADTRERGSPAWSLAVAHPGIGRDSPHTLRGHRSGPDTASDVECMGRVARDHASPESVDGVIGNPYRHV